MATSNARLEKEIFTSEQDRTYVLYRFLLNATAKEIHADLVKVRGEDVPSLRTVQRWIQAFKEGRRTVEDQPRSGRPREAVTKDLIAHVEAIVQKDPHATLDEIAVEAGISHGSVHVILKEHLRMAKLCARWIPHSLTPQQKEERVDCSRCLLAKMKRWGANGLKMLVTGDETYVAFYSPESRTQRQQWVRKGESHALSVRPSTFQPKVLYTIFINCEGIVAKVMSPPSTTVNAQFYRETVLPSVIAGIRERHPTGTIHLHHDNAPPHRSSNVQLFLQEQHIDLVSHPPYSPDLSPCDFFLFPRLKSALAGKKFESRQSVSRAVSDALSLLTQNDFVSCFSDWKLRLKKCIEVEGEYLEHLE